MAKLRWLIIGLAVGIASSPAHAALDPELQTPYQLQIVLHFGDSRLFTDVYCKRVEGGLHDYLQAAFAPLARVEVVRTHPRLADILARGLQKSLDTWKERTEIKTHFVLFDYVNGHYEIQARQHDGLTGQASPIVRTDRTRDRAFAARAAALMVEKDFGIVGTFATWPTGPGGGMGDPPLPITIQLKGGGLGAPLNRWLQKGEILQVVAIPDSRREPRPVTNALLRVLESPNGDGTCSCQIFWRYKPPADRDQLGFRCMKIATVRGPLRLRVVQKAVGNGLPTSPVGMRVEVRRNSFSEKGELVDNLDTQGAFDSAKPRFGDKGIFDNLALVSLISGTPRARLPVPLVDDQPVHLMLEPISDDGGLVAIRRQTWKREVADSYLVLVSLFEELLNRAQKAGADQRAETLKIARAGLKRTQNDHARLTDERSDLLKARPTDERLLAQEDKILKALEDRTKELSQFITAQELNLKEETDPKRLELLNEVEQANLFMKKAEYDKALAVLEKVASKKEFKFQGVAERLELLKERWAIKNDNHSKARAFIYDVWPKLDTAGLEARLKEAADQLKVCIAAGDGLTPHRFLLGLEEHVARLTKEAGNLNTAEIDDESKLKSIDQISKKLSELDALARGAIKPLGK